MAPDPTVPIAISAAARKEALLADIDRAHRGIETAGIELAAALEAHRFALAAAVAALGPGLGIAEVGDADVRARAQPKTPPSRGRALHKALGAAAVKLIAARRGLAEARHRLSAARGAWRKARREEA
jgi:hypothetical protein